MKNSCSRYNIIISLFFTLNILVLLPDSKGQGSNPKPELHFTISMDEPSNRLLKVELDCKGWISDTIDFKMPQWMPGYYQIMNYYKDVYDFSVQSPDGKKISVLMPDEKTWRVIIPRKKGFRISYNVKAEKKFVANNFLDTTQGYIVPPATFIYIDKNINTPVRLTVKPYKGWSRIATGLEQVKGALNEYTAPDFDIFYDCPLLIGNLDELPSFQIRGVKHRFIAFNPGTFNRENFISVLKKTIEAGVDLIGEIPYSQYTFIGIGPGYGGIEHLNNTTVSFNGNGLDNAETMKRMLKFLAHEYFHHYNVKRIRPFELGPFDYGRENHTNLLWVSEGLSVYYEYIMLRRAGLISDDDLLSDIAGNINNYENDPGRIYQSLIGASYNTWSDGPFGNKPGTADRSISYYEKGPVIGMILDLAIRKATKNNKSLDDVMRLLYYEYYKNLQRGFTDAEFQEACEVIAGVSLAREFEYVYTTTEIDYADYLSYAGLQGSEKTNSDTGKRKFSLSRITNPDTSQTVIFRSMTGE